MTKSGYTIRFDFEGGTPLFAGKTPDNALAFAPTLETAEIWPEAVVAERFLANGYGMSAQAVGRVVKIEDGVEVDS